MITVDVWQAKPEHDGGDYGFCSRVAGTENEKPFCVDVWCEHDGRDVEIEVVWGIRPDMDFFDVLCEHGEWVDALAKDYKRWEALPRISG